MSKTLLNTFLINNNMKIIKILIHTNSNFKLEKKKLR